jgi:type IV pilus biogenesis protein CpaD/CtpE
MAMSSIRETAMRILAARLARPAAVIGAALALSGCIESTLRIEPDFGVAVRQDAAAQIADPDAHYSGRPAPASDGSRTAIAQTRYRTDKVTPPPAPSTSQGGGGGGGGAAMASP